MCFERLADLHFARYPLMREGDWLKLVYQASFGPGHFIPDAGKALKRLEDELDSMVAMPAQPLSEPAGHGVYRLYLAPATQAGLRCETIAALFMRASRTIQPDPDRFKADVRALIALGCRRGWFDENALLRMSAACEQDGWAPFSHSEEYRRAYAPAYRLIDSTAEKYLNLIARIDRLLTRKGTARVVIDGCCASGKTTLARFLGEVYGAQVFHMDDYFLPFERKTPQRLAEPGGNVDYERFSADIAAHLDDDMLSYRPYDCQSGRLAAPITSKRQAVQVIEGAYSMRPDLVPDADISVCLRVSPDEQINRLRARSPGMLDRFINEWIPMEEKYFAYFDISRRCDMIYIG